MPDMPAVLRLTLEQARTLVDITPAELARRAGVGRDLVSVVEREGSRPSLENGLRLIAALRASGMPGLQPEHLWPVEVATTAKAS
jgi:DNA-binding XRE family transcriptional regulator